MCILYGLHIPSDNTLKLFMCVYVIHFCHLLLQLIAIVLASHAYVVFTYIHTYNIVQFVNFWFSSRLSLVNIIQCSTADMYDIMSCYFGYRYTPKGMHRKLVDKVLFESIMKSPGIRLRLSFASLNFFGYFRSKYQRFSNDIFQILLRKDLKRFLFFESVLKFTRLHILSYKHFASFLESYGHLKKQVAKVQNILRWL